MDCYQAYYCGLCQSLGRKYGTAARMALSYDMTFAALLLTALYDPPTQTSQGRCAPHPLRTRPRAVNEFTDYAADMTVVLAYTIIWMTGRTTTNAAACGWQSSLSRI